MAISFHNRILCASAHPLRPALLYGGIRNRYIGPFNKLSRSQSDKKSPGKPVLVYAVDDDLGNLDSQLKDDLERLKKFSSNSTNKTPTSPTFNTSSSSSSLTNNNDDEPESPFGGIKETTDKILIADFFFILFALAWLGVGLVVKKDQPGVLNTWLQLWPMVFQPAIGVLMLGALTSGAVGWAKENIFQGKK